MGRPLEPTQNAAILQFLEQPLRLETRYPRTRHVHVLVAPLTPRHQDASVRAIP